MRVTYTGIFLDDESRAILKDKFPPIDNWTEYYHHMTICLGAMADRTDIGKQITLTVTGVGKDYCAYAARVDGYISNNTIKHVTLCIAPGAKPVNSNDIAEWTDIEPFTITGIITEHTVSVPLKATRLNVATLVVELGHPKTIIGKVNSEMKTRGIGSVETNRDAIISIISDLAT